MPELPAFQAASVGSGAVPMSLHWRSMELTLTPGAEEQQDLHVVPPECIPAPGPVGGGPTETPGWMFPKGQVCLPFLCANSAKSLRLGKVSSLVSRAALLPNERVGPLPWGKKTSPTLKFQEFPL